MDSPTCPLRVSPWEKQLARRRERRNRESSASVLEHFFIWKSLTLFLCEVVDFYYKTLPNRNQPNMKRMAAAQQKIVFAKPLNVNIHDKKNGFA
ncbi:hypothetical protein [Nostoc sp.]|uniref:hypothetical protein n=1 Tax=Nostoc sp. TaxID=1180 RepID=UPI002FF5FFC6